MAHKNSLGRDAIYCKLSNSYIQVLEAAFKNETVGLATREEFLNKRNTLKDRQLEEAKRKREQELQLAGKLPFCRSSLLNAVLQAYLSRHVTLHNARSNLNISALCKDGTLQEYLFLKARPSLFQTEAGIYRESFVPSKFHVAAEKAERQKKKARKEAKTKLSFFNDEDAQLAEDEEGSAEVSPSNLPVQF